MKDAKQIIFALYALILSMGSVWAQVKCIDPNACDVTPDNQELLTGIEWVKTWGTIKNYNSYTVTNYRVKIVSAKRDNVPLPVLIGEEGTSFTLTAGQQGDVTYKRTFVATGKVDITANFANSSGQLISSTLTPLSSSVKICTANASLSGPANNASYVSGTNVTLSWTPDVVGGCTITQYELEVTTASGTASQTITGTSFTLPSATQSFTWRVRARIGTGSTTKPILWGGYSSSRTVNITALPCSAPTGLSVGTTTVDAAPLSWGTFGNHTIHYREQGFTTWQTATANGTNITLTNLGSGKTYEWELQSNCTGNNSSWVGGSNFTTQPCSPPTNLNASNITSTSVLVSWNAALYAVQGYTVQYRVVGAGFWTGSIDVPSGTSTTIIGLAASTPYEFRVRNECTISLGSIYSNPFPFTTSAPNTCGNPTNPQVNNITLNTAQLGWTAVSGANGYDIQFKKVTATIWTDVFSVTGTSYTLNALDPNQEYEWQIQANCNLTSSIFVSGNNFTTTTTPTKILNFTGSFNYGDVQTVAFEDYSIAIQNTGNTNLSVNVVNGLAAGFTLISPISLPFTVPAGGTTTMTIRFSPTAVQAYNATVTLTTDATSTTNNSFLLSGNGVNVATTKILNFTGTHDFSDVGVMQNAYLNNIPISNTGNSVLNLTGINLPIGYSLYSPTLPMVISAGGAVTITIRFTPPAVGTYAGNITLTSDATSTTTNSFSVTGNGIINTPITYTITGKTVTTTGANIAGTTVSVAGGASTTTDASGNYSLTVSAGTNVVLTAAKTGWNFSNSPMSLGVINANSTNNTFVGTVAVTPLTITGQNPTPNVGIANSTDFLFVCYINGGNGSPVVVSVEFSATTSFVMTNSTMNQYTLTRKITQAGTRTFRYKAEQSGGIVYSPVFSFVVNGLCGTGLPANVPCTILSPVVGDVIAQSAFGGPQPVVNGWSFWQRGGAGHEPGAGIGGADDTFAWDFNLNYPSYNFDSNRPVFAVADGVIRTFDSWGGTSFGQVLIEHTNPDGTVWYSGFVHLSLASITNPDGTKKWTNGMAVTTTTEIGRIAGRANGNDNTYTHHGHMIVYYKDANGDLISVNRVITPRVQQLANPIMTAPANNTDASTPVTLQWQAVAGATFYQIYVVEIRPTGVDTTVVNEPNVGNVTSYPIPAGKLIGGKTYRWRVIARNPASSSSGTNPAFKFTAKNNTQIALYYPQTPIFKVYEPLNVEPAKTVTLLMFYTQKALTYFEYRYGLDGLDKLKQALHISVQVANDSYTNSGISLKLQLLDILPVQTNYKEKIDANKVVDGNKTLNNFLSPTDGVIDDVYNLRNTYCADLIGLVANMSNGGGFAPRPGYCFVESLESLDAALNTGYANFSNNFVNNGSSLLAHEIGHNLGCDHDPKTDITRYNNPTLSCNADFTSCICPTSNRGFVFKTTSQTGNLEDAGTIMSYEQAVIKYFSGPNNIFEGTTLGNSNCSNNTQIIKDSMGKTSELVIPTYIIKNTGNNPLIINSVTTNKNWLTVEVIKWTGTGQQMTNNYNSVVNLYGSYHIKYTFQRNEQIENTFPVTISSGNVWNSLRGIRVKIDWSLVGNNTEIGIITINSNSDTQNPFTFQIEAFPKSAIPVAANLPLNNSISFFARGSIPSGLKLYRVKNGLETLAGVANEVGHIQVKPYPSFSIGDTLIARANGYKDFRLFVNQAMLDGEFTLPLFQTYTNDQQLKNGSMRLLHTGITIQKDFVTVKFEGENVAQRQIFIEEQWINCSDVYSYYLDTTGTRNIIKGRLIGLDGIITAFTKEIDYVKPTSFAGTVFKVDMAVPEQFRGAYISVEGQIVDTLKSTAQTLYITHSRNGFTLQKIGYENKFYYLRLSDTDTTGTNLPFNLTAQMYKKEPTLFSTLIDFSAMRMRHTENASFESSGGNKVRFVQTTNHYQAFGIQASTPTHSIEKTTPNADVIDAHISLSVADSLFKAKHYVLLEEDGVITKLMANDTYHIFEDTLQLVRKKNITKTTTRLTVAKRLAPIVQNPILNLVDYGLPSQFYRKDSLIISLDKFFKIPDSLKMGMSYELVSYETVKLEVYRQGNRIIIKRKANQNATAAIRIRATHDGLVIEKDFLVQGVTANEDPIKAMHIVVYPNPARDEVKITFDETKVRYCKGRLVSQSGKEVLSLEKVEKDAPISVAHLPNGFYILELEVGKGLIIRNKLIINK